MRTARAFAALLAAAGLLAGACGRAAPRRNPTPAPPTRASQPAPAPATPAPAAVPGTWAALDAPPPVWVQRNSAAIGTSPTDPHLLAYCAPAAVRVSQDGGATWTSVPTAGVPAALDPTGYALPAAGGQVPACTAAAAIAGHRASALAAFSVGQAKYGEPPIFYTAVATTDGGAGWRAVPVPAGFDAGGFGGFEPMAGGTAGVLLGQPLGRAGQPSFALQESTDGGATWHPGSLDCPAAGPCLRWGPAPSGTGSCAMHGYEQPVLRSRDGGRSWTDSQPPARGEGEILANGCLLNELAYLGGDRTLLVSAGPGSVPLRLSTDGGGTWSAVTLPPQPGADPTAPAAFNGLQLLPDGTLWSTNLERSGSGFAQRMYLLRPGAAAWCAARGAPSLPSGADSATARVAGGRLWWLEPQGASGVTAAGVALASLRC